MEKQKTNLSRRKILQTTSVAGGIAAVGAWTKPALDLVVLPAHAQTSAVAMSMNLGGSTSTTPVASLNKDNSSGLANSVLDAIIPTAVAGGVLTSASCGAFTVNGPDDYTHCIELVFDEAVPSSEFTLNLSGPDIYYGLQCYFASSAVYYAGVKNLSGTASGTLSDQEFTVSLGDFEFQGTVADDFLSASGVVTQTAGSYMNLGNFNVGSQAYCDTGYSAYWAVTESNNNCSFGSGAYNSGRVIVVGASYACPA